MTQQPTKIKAIIRYNQLDGANVAYIKQGCRFFKMLDNKRIRPMGKTIVFLSAITKSWSAKTKVQIVYEDEQLMFNGTPVNVVMDTFHTKVETLNVEE